MSAVFFKKAEYQYPVLRPLVFQMLEDILGNRIQSQARVLIKPNLLTVAKPEHAILTHPLLVRVAAEYVLEKGARPLIADSPGMGSFERIFREGGYTDAVDHLKEQVKIKPFKETVKVDIGEPFGQIEIARSAIEADLVINLAKLKSHTQMLLTLGVKNMFGCVVGLKKPEWHLRSGTKRHIFARLLVQIYQAIGPAVTLIDGIVALEGHGPGKRGNPRHLGVLVSGASAPFADAAICKMLGLDPQQLPTCRAAKELGLLNASSNIIGDFTKISNFKLPPLGPLSFGPKWLQPYLRKHLIQRPAVDSEACKMCGECWNICPASAITPYAQALGFDYDRCIRCYCCIEICPHGALQAVETPPGKLLRRIAHLNK
ncbi:MAG: DUF362 domain-containing protein [Desulfobacterales bacterium]|jgi:uncharacterized protein (DUF362 family)/ferredoxin